MKAKLLCFFLAIWLCTTGCGDERLTQPMEILFFEGGEENVHPPPVSTIGPVPPEIQKLLWGDEDVLMTQLKDVLDDGVYTDEQGRKVHDSANIAVDTHFLPKICLIREQKEYFTRYLDVDGVVILGSRYVSDRYFYAARDILLAMTAKDPRLREALRPSDKHRPWLGPNNRYLPGRRFHFILSHQIEDQLNIPLTEHIGGVLNLGICGQPVCVAVVQQYPVPNRHKIHMYPFVHEVAHAIHFAINTFDPTFDDRVRAAYKDAVNNKNSYWDGDPRAAPLKNYMEYWAWSVTEWFYDFTIVRDGREAPDYVRFREKDPLMHALLEEWFEFRHLHEFEEKQY